MINKKEEVDPISATIFKTLIFVMLVVWAISGGIWLKGYSNYSDNPQQLDELNYRPSP